MHCLRACAIDMIANMDRASVALLSTRGGERFRTHWSRQGDRSGDWVDIDLSNVLVPRGTIIWGINSCSCSVMIADPWLGFGCHVLGWSQIRCPDRRHHHWGPSHNRRVARASLSGIVGGFHSRETWIPWWIEPHARLWLYQYGSAQCAVCVCGCTLGCVPGLCVLLYSLHILFAKLSGLRTF